VTALERDLDFANASLAEVALRFVLSNPAVSTVIPGIRTVRNVERNASAPDRGPLDTATLQMLKRHQWERNFYS